LERVSKSSRKHFPLTIKTRSRWTKLTRASRALHREACHSLLRQQKQFFSLIATFTPGSDREISSVAKTEAIPLICPFTLFPVDVVALNRYVFYIHSGLREQMCALVEFAATNVATKSSRIVLLYPARADLIEVVEAVEAQTREKGWDLVSRVDYFPNRFDAGELIKKMSNEKIDLVVFLGEESEARAFLREVRDTEWAPYILFPGALMGTAVLEIPPRIKDRVYLAYPTLPQDRQEGGIAELAALRKKRIFR
jgi:ABC-type branched-subunit amino acid transport system substrate-binding protein